MITLHTWDVHGFFAGTIDIPDRFEGQGLPADTCEDAPPATALPAWQGWQRVGDAWQQSPDNRGRQGFVGYTPHTCSTPELPEDFTDEAPVPEPLTLAQEKPRAVEAVKAASYTAETAGITVQGLQIPTDRDSQSMITGAVVSTLLDPTKTTRWQTGTTHDGIPVFAELGATQLQAIGQTVRAHVQACFDTRDAKFVEIGKLSSPEAVQAWLETELNTGWPG